MTTATLLLARRFGRTKAGHGFARFIQRVALAGIVLGVAALIVVSSVMNGFEQQLKQRILGVVPQLSVLPAKGLALDAWQTLAAQLPELGQQALLPQVNSTGVLQHQGELQPVLIQGVWPELAASEVQLAPLQAGLQLGRMEALQPGSYRVLIGETLARELNLWPGDQVRVIAAAGGTYTPFGLLPAQRQFTVAGVIAMRSDVDAQLLLMHGVDAARLLRLQDQQVTGLRYFFADPFASIPAQAKLDAALDASYRSESWRQRYGELFDAVALEKTMINLMLMLIIAVAAFNLVSALMLMIEDKRGDIAILQTMGMRSGSIYRVFLLQGTRIGMLGSLLGCALGLLLSWQLNPLLKQLGIETNLTVEGGLPVLVVPADIAVIASLAVLLTVLATLFPAWRASRLAPAEALRYE